MLLEDLLKDENTAMANTLEKIYVKELAQANMSAVMLKLFLMGECKMTSDDVTKKFEELSVKTEGLLRKTEGFNVFTDYFDGKSSYEYTMAKLLNGILK